MLDIKTADEELGVAREALFRVLGRCLIRIQAVELQLKRLLATRTLRGSVEELETHLAARHADYKTNTLGTLVKELLAHYLVSDSYEHPDGPEPTNPVQIFVHFQTAITMPEERLVELRSTFSSVVSMRNDVVHSLAEFFPMGTPEGCSQALEFLGGFEKRIDEVWQELRAWAESQDKARMALMGLMQTREFEEFVFDGILPDGTVNWETAGIVRALRAAANTQRASSWMSLVEAIEWIRRKAPSQIPSRYNCTTYRQVVHESRAFEVKREVQPNGSTQLFYRSK